MNYRERLASYIENGRLILNDVQEKLMIFTLLLGTSGRRY